jgi:uncharacterized protein
MRLNDVAFGAQRPIEGYGAGGFRIAGRVHDGPLLALPGRALAWTPAEPLDAASFAEIVALAPTLDVVLVGVGAEIAPLPPEARAALEAAGLWPEVMATPSACRTYNVLIAEERRVAAALLPV